MTRNGKIARLPRAVRDEVNRRMDDGEPGSALLGWLNAREEVQAVLKDKFGGRPINKQNLSEWRQGGFKDWRRGQASLERSRGIWEAVKHIREGTEGEPLANVVAEMAALALARQLRAAARLTDGKEQARATLPIVREVVRLRASDREYEEAKRRAEVGGLGLKAGGEGSGAEDEGRRGNHSLARAATGGLGGDHSLALAATGGLRGGGHSLALAATGELRGRRHLPAFAATRDGGEEASCWRSRSRGTVGALPGDGDEIGGSQTESRLIQFRESPPPEFENTA